VGAQTGPATTAEAGPGDDAGAPGGPVPVNVPGLAFTGISLAPLVKAMLALALLGSFVFLAGCLMTREETG
jgi:hypothetical protein